MVIPPFPEIKYKTMSDRIHTVKLLFQWQVATSVSDLLSQWASNLPGVKPPPTWIIRFLLAQVVKSQSYYSPPIPL